VLLTPRGESRYFVLALFTVSMIAGSMLYGGIGALVPYVGRSFDLPHAQLGLIATAMVAGGFLTVAVSGTLCDRFGDKAMLLESGILMGGSMMAAAIFPNYLWLLGCVFLYGIGNAASNPAGTHAILAFFSREQRGLAMGIRQTGMPVGGALGSLLFALVAWHYGYRGALLTGGTVVLVFCTAAALLYRQPKELCGEHVSILKLIEDIGHIGKDPRLILVTVTAMLLMCLQIIFITFFPITLVRGGGYSAEIAALIFAGGHLSAGAGRMVWGGLSDHRYRGSRTIPMVYCAILGAGAAMLLSGIGHIGIGLLCIAAFGLGFAGEGWFALAMLALAEIGGEDHAGGAVGFGIMWMLVAAAIAPLLMGALVGTAGYAIAWHVAAAIALVAAVPALMATRMMRAQPAEG
jgi:MFS family permease